ncbi:DNA-methyltransferase [Desulfofundulus luciae]|nr:site-specific DNA-methyltransferase [Desulfofundulus luciae]
MSFHRFLIGHVLDALRSLPGDSVHCVVTSPPYWGMRDYNLPPVLWPEIEYAPMPGLPFVRVPAWEGQLGLEPTPEMYVGHLVLVFREVRRVLRKSGTLWLNLGDSYAGSWGNYHSFSSSGKHEQHLKETTRWNRRAYEVREGFLKSTVSGGLKEKDLVGIPWRVAFALQGDGWWLRSDVVWSKVNGMPESVKDRPTKTHEYVFLLAKSQRYFYDTEAVKEPAVTHLYDKRYLPGTPPRQRTGESWNLHGPLKPHSGFRVLDTTRGRNRRSVWEITTEPFPGAHYAVFPRRLAELCILAGTSQAACPSCGAPWERVVEKEKALSERGRRESGAREYRLADVGLFSGMAGDTHWHPTCSCPNNDGSARCVVLDPFGGAGTTNLAAMALNRDSIYIDLKREYAEMAIERCGFGGTLLDCHDFVVVETATAETPA